MTEIRAIIAITGNRKHTDKNKIWSTLDRILAKYPKLELIHGGQTGADTIGAQWAIDRRITVGCYADWSLGKKGGPLRNQQMVDRLVQARSAGMIVGVVAFPLPESTGTYDMIDKSKTANIPVWII